MIHKNKSSISKQDIIENLYKIICSNTSTRRDNKVKNNDYFKRRVLGFKAEIEFELFIKNQTNYKFFEGGMFLSPNLDGSKNMKNQFSYVTIDSLPPNEYIDIYTKIASWDEIKIFNYIFLSFDNWTEKEFEIKKTQGGKRIKDKILVPNFKFYNFDPKNRLFTENTSGDFKDIISLGNERKVRPSKSHLRKREQFEYFKEYKLDTLLKIYADRYFLDVEKNKVLLNIIDFDAIIKQGEKYFVVETKEKEPIKDGKQKEDEKLWSYGWDTRRLIWYKYIQEKIGWRVLYSVRQIDNREDRGFIKWDSIFLDDFLKGTSWSNSTGGGGGEDTLTVPYNHFSDLQESLFKSQ